MQINLKGEEMEKILQKARTVLPSRYGSVVLLFSLLAALLTTVQEGEGPAKLLVASLVIVGLGGVVTTTCFFLHFQSNQGEWKKLEEETEEPLLLYEPYVQAIGGVGMILFSFFGIKLFLS